MLPDAVPTASLAPAAAQLQRRCRFNPKHPSQPEEGRPGALLGLFRAGLVMRDTLDGAAQILGGILRLNGIIQGNAPDRRNAEANFLAEPGASVLAFPWLRAVVRTARAAPRGGWEEQVSLTTLGSFVTGLAIVRGAFRLPRPALSRQGVLGV